MMWRCRRATDFPSYPITVGLFTRLASHGPDRFANPLQNAGYALDIEVRGASLYAACTRADPERGRIAATAPQPMVASE